ncbi:hypothetical protein BD289DRAFT_488825 [Coniella lustricola]|uniref:Dimethylaniline monooxygenase n=1 Tax=Coniella lustricola TaxID=2025994 RepID=A0A2T3A2Y1_9PEZI|nr:hypothetical protein BD289DRAFT_488825 [Coniella lustricola]
MVHKPIKSVAVIGAGISGVSAGAHLLRQGFEVVVFERSDVAGGVWKFDPRTGREPESSPTLYPSPPSSLKTQKSTDGFPNHRQHNKTAEDVLLDHAPPGPCYAGLRNNIPTPVMRSTLLRWPKGTPDHVTHNEIESYIQALARETGTHAVTLYNTRVEEAVKNPETGTWQVKSRTLAHKSEKEEASLGEISFHDKDWTFDAVIVAAGHYHVPLVPAIPGLAEWKRKFPSRVMHSKNYRFPEAFKDQNVFLIGAGVSSLDIAKELEHTAHKTYQSSRGGLFDLDKALLPSNSERVPGLLAFKLDEGKGFDEEEEHGSLDNTAPIPGTIHLTDGRVLSNIHQVIVASGYQTTYPFLKGLESDTLPVEEADGEIVITADKCVTHNLHKDIFYIPDPTLAFVGVPYYTSTFSMFDFQAEVVARVYAGLAKLPSRSDMEGEYAARKAKGDKGKAFHSLIRNQVSYMDEILEWVNEDLKEGANQEKRMKGVDEEWYRGYEQFKEKSRRLIPVDSSQIQQPIASRYYDGDEGGAQK